LGGTGDDLFIAVAADLVAGESIDGGADTDTLRIDGGGGVSLAGVTLTNLEAITLTDTTGTTLTASSAQAGLITSAAGSNDTVNVSDLAFLTTFATPATRAAAFGLIDGLGTKGVENVQWTEGGATNVATQRPGGGILITSTDNGGNTWATSTFTFDGAGNRLEKVTTFDNGQVTTHAFFGDAVVSATTTNIPGANDTTTVLYDAAGRWDSLLITYDAGGSTLYTYDDAGRVDTRTETAVNGFVSEHTYNDANQRVSVTVTDGPANQYTWASSTQTLDPITQKTTQKTVTFDNGNTSIESYTNGVATSIIVTDNPGGDEFAWNTIETVYGQFTRHLYDNGTGIVQGTATGNTIEGANGSNDALIGNGGSDTFVFRPGGGTDRILDFTDGVDTLNLLAFGVDEVADLSAYTVTQQGPHLLLDFGGGDTLRINNFVLSNLGNDDLFGVT
jgi:YD repeat-containing protein